MSSWRLVCSVTELLSSNKACAFAKTGRIQAAFFGEEFWVLVDLLSLLLLRPRALTPVAHSFCFRALRLLVSWSSMASRSTPLGSTGTHPSFTGSTSTVAKSSGLKPLGFLTHLLEVFVICIRAAGVSSDSARQAMTMQGNPHRTFQNFYHLAYQSVTLKRYCTFL